VNGTPRGSLEPYLPRLVLEWAEHDPLEPWRELDGSLVSVDLAEGAKGTALPPKKAGGPARITAPMPGKLVRVLVEPGQDVAAGEGLVVVEAMKMENELRAPKAGRVKDVPVKEGQAVEAGALLVVVE